MHTYNSSQYIHTHSGPPWELQPLAGWIKRSGLCMKVFVYKKSHVYGISQMLRLVVSHEHIAARHTRSPLKYLAKWALQINSHVIVAPHNTSSHPIRAPPEYRRIKLRVGVACPPPPRTKLTATPLKPVASEGQPAVRAVITGIRAVGSLRVHLLAELVRAGVGAPLTAWKGAWLLQRKG